MSTVDWPVETIWGKSTNVGKCTLFDNRRVPKVQKLSSGAAAVGPQPACRAPRGRGRVCRRGGRGLDAGERAGAAPRVGRRGRAPAIRHVWQGRAAGGCAAAAGFLLAAFALTSQRENVPLTLREEDDI